MAACAWTIIACVGLLGDAAWQSPPLTLSLSSLHPSSPFPNSPISSLPSVPPFPQQQKAASLLLSNTTRCHLSREDLVPGSRYVARVRARPGQASGFSGQYSEWSVEASWETPEGSVGRSEAVQGWKRCLRSQTFPVT